VGGTFVKEAGARPKWRDEPLDDEKKTLHDLSILSGVTISPEIMEGESLVQPTALHDSLNY
jgi:hypothetical protein